MTWRIDVKPTSHLLASYTWTAQSSDGESYLISEQPLTTSQDAMEQAQMEVAVYEHRRKIVQDNTTVIEAYEPPLGEVPAGVAME